MMPSPVCAMVMRSTPWVARPLAWPELSVRKVAGRMPWVALATRARRWVQREPAVVGRAPPWAASAVGWKVATTCTEPPGPCVATEGVGKGGVRGEG